MAVLPLQKIRVIDMTHAWAGPMCTALFADMGAQVIKVEACHHMDDGRLLLFPDNDPGEEPWNRGLYYVARNRNKLGLAVDVSKPQGKAVLQRLVEISDVLVQNWTPRVMRNLGLEYEALSEVRPDLIMASLSGYGHTGPYRNYRASGQATEPMSGVSWLTGYRGGPPIRTGISYSDPILGLQGACAILAALNYRSRTGKGQHIDVAQVEATMPMIGEALMDYTMNKRVQGRLGNRHAYMAPHGCYRCRGDDQWLVIAVSSDEEWQRFANAIGNPGWTKEERFSNDLSRWENQDELDRLVEGWTLQHDHYQAMGILQNAGVAAGAVLNSKELLTDDHMKSRRLFETCDHPGTGIGIIPGIVAKLSKTPGSVRTPAPLLGEHNEFVLGSILGASREEIDRLIADRIIGTTPVPTPDPKDIVARRIVPSEVWQRLGVVAGVDKDYKQKLGVE